MYIIIYNVKTTTHITWCREVPETYCQKPILEKVVSQNCFTGIETGPTHLAPAVNQGC